MTKQDVAEPCIDTGVDKTLNDAHNTATQKDGVPADLFAEFIPREAARQDE